METSPRTDYTIQPTRDPQFQLTPTKPILRWRGLFDKNIRIGRSRRESQCGTIIRAAQEDPTNHHLCHQRLVGGSASDRRLPSSPSLRNRNAKPRPTLVMISINKNRNKDGHLPHHRESPRGFSVLPRSAMIPKMI